MEAKWTFRLVSPAHSLLTQMAASSLTLSSLSVCSNSIAKSTQRKAWLASIRLGQPSMSPPLQFTSTTCSCYTTQRTRASLPSPCSSLSTPPCSKTNSQSRYVFLTFSCRLLDSKISIKPISSKTLPNSCEIITDTISDQSSELSVSTMPSLWDREGKV